MDWSASERLFAWPLGPVSGQRNQVHPHPQVKNLPIKGSLRNLEQGSLARLSLICSLGAVPAKPCDSPVGSSCPIAFHEVAVHKAASEGGL